MGLPDKDGGSKDLCRGAFRRARGGRRAALDDHRPRPAPAALAAAYALLLLEGGRVRESGVITERLVASPAAEPEVRWLALFAHSLYLADTGRLDESLRFADEAYRVAPDAGHARAR